jgi:hypothetical protein
MRSILVIALATCAVTAWPQAAIAAEPVAPFTVVRSRGAYVRVDIGVERSRSRLLREATVLTADAAIPARLDRVERVCEQLCGDLDDPTCHFEAIVRAERPVHGPVAVLGGRPRVAAVAAVSIGAPTKADADRSWLLARGFERDGDGGLRWVRGRDGIVLSNLAGQSVYSPPIALSSCIRRAAGPFLVLTCESSAELLYDRQHRGVTLSFADYGQVAAMPQIRLELDGVEAFIVRKGLKASVVVALLVMVDGQWRMHYREPDYPELC